MQHTPAQIQQGSQGCTSLLFSSNEACVLHEELFGLSFLTSLLILAEFYECALIFVLIGGRCLNSVSRSSDLLLWSMFETYPGVAEGCNTFLRAKGSSIVN